MRRCPSCHFWFKPATPGLKACPHCGASHDEATVNESARTVPIARAANWAEAGYFEDLLHRHHVATELVEREQFDAVSGYWQTQIVMLVPESDAARAADLMDAELCRGDTAAPFPRAEMLYDDPEISGPFWRPVIFLLIAGGLAYWATTRGFAGLRHPRAAAPGPREQAAGELWEQLSRSTTPWRQTSRDGTSRLLWRDPTTDALHLKEDLDGDGRYDRWQEFRDGRKTRDVELTPLFSGPDPKF